MTETLVKLTEISVKLSEIPITLTEKPWKLTEAHIKLTEIPIKLAKIPVNLTEKPSNLASVQYSVNASHVSPMETLDVTETFDVANSKLKQLDNLLPKATLDVPPTV